MALWKAGSRSARARMLSIITFAALLPVFTARCATYGSSPDEYDGGYWPAPKYDAGTVPDSGKPSVDATVVVDSAIEDAAPVDASDGGDGSVGPIQGACAVGQTQVGEYSTWSGKVNVHHTTGGAWTVDTDCSSGAGVNTVAYCKKFWPTSTTQVQLPMVSSEMKPFTQGGGTAPNCGGLALHPGITQYACCAP